MKLVNTCIVLGFMVLMTQQERFPYLQGQGAFQVPMSLADRHLGRLYSYFLAQEMAQRMRQPSFQSPLSSFWDQNPVLIENSQPEISSDQLNFDTEARFAAGRPFKPSVPSNDDPAARFFFNAVTSGTNSYSFLQRTIYYISTTTLTTTSTTSCIPAGSFDSPSSTITCRRKRREIINILLNNPESAELLSKNDQELSPTKTLPLEATTKASIERPFGSDAILAPVELSSSKFENYLPESDKVTDATTSRKKRFFIVTSTITSFTFVTLTSTKTLSSLGTKLSCLPATQFFLC